MTAEELLKKHIQEADAILQIDGIHCVGISKDSEGNLFRAAFSHNENTEMLVSNPLLKDCKIVYEELPVDDVLRFPLNETKEYGKDYNRYRPMLGGISICLEDDEYIRYGTLSSFVKSKAPGDNNYYILSNQHVLEKNGLMVYQPDAGKDNQVAIVTDSISGVDSDSAIAKVTDYDFKSGIVEEIGKVNEVRVAGFDDIGKYVLKRGRTTLRTRGIIDSVYCFLKIDDVTVKNEIRIISADGNPYSDSGDSGSPVVFEDDHKLLGIHYAGDGKDHIKGYASSIDSVFKDLNIELAIY